jgi:dienelactone hydrolase
MRVSFRAAMLLAVLLTAGTLMAQASPLDTDPPADASHPASMVEITVPSNGVRLLGALYTAAGAGPHPTAILYHGFPGYEQNLDLAQVLRRAGYNVLAVHYRGSWGVPGTFSFQHAIEDADAQVQWIQSPPVVAQYHVDPTRIVAIGHSLGGYLALSAGARNPDVAAVIAISGASLGHRFAGLKSTDRDKAVAQYMAKSDPVDLLPLAGTSAAALGGEIFEHRDAWDFQALAPALGRRPVLLITADDGSGPTSETLLQTLKAQGNSRARHIVMKTDHPFSDHRVALQRAILSWLGPIGLKHRSD